jgi:PleD family two-component response regulator
LEKDGFEALERIRSSESSDVPVIIVTHSDEHELKNVVLKYGVNDYIVKPYAVKRLESSVKSLVHIIRDFHYDTSGIEEFKMTFDDYISREIKCSRRTQSAFSLLFITMLQIKSESANKPGSEDGRAAVYSIAARKARESLRSTDTLFINNERDIIVVLPYTDHNSARLVCEKLRGQMELEFEKTGTERNECIFPVFVTFPKDGDGFQALMETAFKKVSDKEMLEKIISIPTETRSYADRSYNKFRKWF